MRRIKTSTKGIITGNRIHRINALFQSEWSFTSTHPPWDICKVFEDIYIISIDSGEFKYRRPSGSLLQSESEMLIYNLKERKLVNDVYEGYGKFESLSVSKGINYFITGNSNGPDHRILYFWDICNDHPFITKDISAYFPRHILSSYSYLRVCLVSTGDVIVTADAALPQPLLRVKIEEGGESESNVSVFNAHCKFKLPPLLEQNANGSLELIGVEPHKTIYIWKLGNGELMQKIAIAPYDSIYIYYIYIDQLLPLLLLKGVIDIESYNSSKTRLDMNNSLKIYFSLKKQINVIGLIKFMKNIFAIPTLGGEIIIGNIATNKSQIIRLNPNKNLTLFA